MTWLTKLRTFLGHDESTGLSFNTVVDPEVIKFNENARAALGEAHKRSKEVREVTTSLSQLRARNHFGESIELAMMRKERNA